MFKAETAQHSPHIFKGDHVFSVSFHCSQHGQKSSKASTGKMERSLVVSVLLTVEQNHHAIIPQVA